LLNPRIDYLANDKDCIELLHAKDKPESSVNWLSIFAILVVVVTFCCLIKLGFWQLERAEHKLKVKQQRVAQQHVVLTSLPTTNIDNRWNQRLIKVSGRLLHQYTWLLDNQVHNGIVGYQVLVPLFLEDEERLGVVNLGWVPAPLERKFLPLLERWPGAHAVIGRVHFPSKNPYALASVASNDWPKRIAQIDLTEMAKEIQQPMFDLVIRLEPSSEIGYDKSWRWSNNMTVDKHRGYAFQWFALAVTLLLLSSYFGFRLIKGV